MKQCEGEGQGNCKKCGQRSWMCFLYKVDGAEGCYCHECAKELEKMIFFKHMKDTIIEDQISTIKRLQAELDERTDFEVKLMNYIIELLKEKENEA